MSESESDSSFERIVLRSIAVWFILLSAEVIHGVLRAIVLVPLVGPFRSNQIGVFTGSAIIVAISFITIRWIGAKRTPEVLAVGAIWLSLMVAFELLFGRLVLGHGWERIGADYNIAQGGLMPLGLLILLVSPMLAARWHFARFER